MLVYTYLIDGLLIDTGTSKLRSEFMAAIREEELEQLVISHHHEDHTGNLAELQEALGIRAKAHPLTDALVADPARISLSRHLSWGAITPTTCDALDLTLPIETDHFRFDIHHVPGHAVDQIALHEPSQGWLFSADLYLTSYPKIFMNGESILSSIDSLDRMAALDFDVLYCCHRPKYEGGQSFLLEKKQYLQDFYGGVISEYLKGKAPKEIMRVLGLRELVTMKLLSQGELSVENMVKSCIGDYDKSIESSSEQSS